jgi:osmotically inducible lipoprotein OsmB
VLSAFDRHHRQWQYSCAHHNMFAHRSVIGGDMRQSALAIATIALAATMPSAARADMVGAAAGAGSGLVVAGPVGAVAGGVVGAVFGQPFWGPPISYGACWVDNDFRRHCWHRRYHR